MRRDSSRLRWRGPRPGPPECRRDHHLQCWALTARGAPLRGSSQPIGIGPVTGSIPVRFMVPGVVATPVATPPRLSEFSSICAGPVYFRAYGRSAVTMAIQHRHGGRAGHHGTSSHPHGRCLTFVNSARGGLMGGGPLRRRRILFETLAPLMLMALYRGALRPCVWLAVAARERQSRQCQNDLSICWWSHQPPSACSHAPSKRTVWSGRVDRSGRGVAHDRGKRRQACRTGAGFCR